MTSIELRDWNNLIRLQSSGCPLELSDLPPIHYPFRLLASSSGWMCPIKQGAALVVPVAVVATAPRAGFSGLRITASWLPACARPVAPNSYADSLADGPYGGESGMLNEFFRRGGLERGIGPVSGFVMVMASGLDMCDVALPAYAFLWLQERYGEEYPFLVKFEEVPTDTGVAWLPS